MAKQDTGRVVIRRKRAYGEAHHGGSWKIAYSDFMTSMMSFFLVMWLLLLVPKGDLSAIAEYFRTPLMTAITGGAKLDNSRSIIPGGDPSVIPNPYAQPPSVSDSDESDLRDQENLEDLKLQLENLIEHNPVLKQFRPQLLLDMTPDGLRIQILDQQNRPMFTLGSDVVQPYMRAILRELAPLINELPNSITISGHTDAMRYAAGDRNYSNWELSADRANAARRELVAGGLIEHKVKRILGLGDTVDLIKDDPMAAVNRRISILVLNRRAERRIDAQNEAGAGIQLKERLQELQHDAAPAAEPAPSSPGGDASGEGAAAPGGAQSPAAGAATPEGTQSPATGTAAPEGTPSPAAGAATPGGAQSSTAGAPPPAAGAAAGAQAPVAGAATPEGMRSSAAGAAVPAGAQPPAAGSSVPGDERLPAAGAGAGAPAVNGAGTANGSAAAAPVAPNQQH